jgi:hypothetical protein
VEGIKLFHQLSLGILARSPKPSFEKTLVDEREYLKRKLIDIQREILEYQEELGTVKS